MGKKLRYLILVMVLLVICACNAMKPAFSNEQDFGYFASNGSFIKVGTMDARNIDYQKVVDSIFVNSRYEFDIYDTSKPIDSSGLPPLLMHGVIESDKRQMTVTEHRDSTFAIATDSLIGESHYNVAMTRNSSTWKGLSVLDECCLLVVLLAIVAAYMVYKKNK